MRLAGRLQSPRVPHSMDSNEYIRSNIERILYSKGARGVRLFVRRVLRGFDYSFDGRPRGSIIRSKGARGVRLFVRRMPKSSNILRINIFAHIRRNIREYSTNIHTYSTNIAQTTEANPLQPCLQHKTCEKSSLNLN